MKKKMRSVASAVALVGSGSLLFAFANNGCMSFLAESALTSADFCFIFDCQNGLFGGTIDPCAGPGDNTAGAEDTLPFFSDCPGDE